MRGFRETREELEKISDEKAVADDQKSHTLEEMSNLVRVLNSKIADKKTVLAPLLRGFLSILIHFVHFVHSYSFQLIFKELRPLRVHYQESLPEYESKKSEYDAQVEMIDNSITSVTQVTISENSKR